jgi:hypothetical protein
MREIRLSGSEGGGVESALPTPIMFNLAMLQKLCGIWLDTDGPRGSCGVDLEIVGVTMEYCW